MQKPFVMRCKWIVMLAAAAAAVVLLIMGTVAVGQVPAVTGREEATFTRTTEAGEEEYEDETVCPVWYESEAGDVCVVNYTYEEWEALPTGHTVNGYVYRLADGRTVGFDHLATDAEIAAAVRDLNGVAQTGRFGAAMALGLFAVSLLVVTLFGQHFTNYEQIWFLSVMALAAVVSILAPEEDVNGVQGLVIMALYLADTFLNILCELLISKQSKWNFIVSVFVEITEIVICLVLAYRFATMASTLFFWLPVDIISFVNWHKHPDRQEEDLTKVRKLSGWAEVLVLAGIAVFTLVVGYLLSGLDITTDLFRGDELMQTVVCYLDACVTAVGICNGLFILFRLREQWIAWFTDAILEAVINILSGQYVLLVLKAGYLTNSTYGYIKWTRYIKAHKEVAAERTVF